MIISRKEFLRAAAAAAASACVPAAATAAPEPKSEIKRGVSLYSYQEEYYTRAMNLEDCLADVASMGAEGVELIAEEMIPDYPDPSGSWVDSWHRLMDKYRTKPACLDTFVDVTWGGHRQMAPAEAVETLRVQLQLSHRLGFKIMRPMTGPVAVPTPEMIEKALPYAEKYDVRIAPEIHTPIPLKGQFIDSYMEIIARTKTRHLGFTLDTGIFAKRLPRVFLDYRLRQGASDNVVRYLDEAYRQGVSATQRVAEVVKMGGTEADRICAMMSAAFGPADNTPKDLHGIMPYVYNIHGKSYEMTESLEEYSIPYNDIVPVLIAGGYDGYINSEFEGQRNTQDAFETDSCEQVRRQHVMFRRLLGEI